MMMTIALRFIPTLLEEADKIMKAQMARGADFESGNIVKRARNLIPLLVPLLSVPSGGQMIWPWPWNPVVITAGKDGPGCMN